MTVLRPLILLALFGACSRKDDHAATDHQRNQIPVDSVSPADVLMSGSAVAGIHLCDSLTRVSVTFPGARDTVLFGEGGGSGWPSKTVTLAAGENLLFETSWVDTIHVWRITTTSARFRTRNGLRVGSTMADVYATGDSVAFEYPEGILAITLDRDSVGILVDDSSAAAFWRRFNYAGDPRAILARGARIKSLGIGADCRLPKAAA